MPSHLAALHLEEEGLRLDVAGTQRLSAGSLGTRHFSQYELSCQRTQVQNSQTFTKHLLHIGTVNDCALNDLLFPTS